MNHEPLTVLALLGTERGTPPPSPHPVLDTAWATLDWADRPQALLSACALVAVARAAGAVAFSPASSAASATAPAAPVSGAAPAVASTLTPVANPPAAEPAPPETSQPCPPRAALHLRRMLAGEYAEFLPEWLALAARAGQRAAYRDLPGLLRLARRERALRPALAAVLGERGRWLARRQEDGPELLAGATAMLDETAWTTGTLPERVAWLRQTRATEPVRAATVLAAAWPEAAGEERERLLAVVAAAPTSHDVALLEEALRDRRREVRATARAALLRRPESAFATRARELVAAMATLTGPEASPTLALYPPEAFDPAWKALGIEEKPPAGTGARAYWARQWLGAVPLSAWTTRLDMSADKLLALPRDEAWSEVLLLGWLDAALAAPEPDHAEALAHHLVQLPPQAWPKAAPPPGTVLLRLLDALAPEAAARVLTATERAAPSAPPASPVGHDDTHALYLELLLRSEFALPAPVALRALEIALAGLQAQPYPRLHAQHARALARRLPLAIAAEALRRLAALPTLSAPTEELLRAIEFRQQLHLAFTPSTAPVP